MPISSVALNAQMKPLASMAAKSIIWPLRQSNARLFSICRHYHKNRIPALSEIKPVDLKSYSKESLPSETISSELSEELKHPQEPVAREPENEGLIKSFLFGSAKLQKEAVELEKSFSSQLQRGKLVHEIVTHKVKPGMAAAYVDLLCETVDKIGTPQPYSRLIGSWRVVVGGDLDTYVHLWEYDGFAGVHLAQGALYSNQVFRDYVEKSQPMLRERTSQIIQEFSFWGGTAKPRQLGGIFELRSYDLKPGTMVDWEMQWRKGIEYRRKVMEPVGAWFSSIGRLNRVYHLWQFTDLQHRKISRQKSWEMSGWAETTHETVKLIDSMETVVLVPLPFSPLS